MRNFRLSLPVEQVRGFIVSKYADLVKGSCKRLSITTELHNAFDIAAVWLTSGKSYGLKIMGGCGTGKSTLAKAIQETVNLNRRHMITERPGYINTYYASEIADNFRENAGMCELYYRFYMLCIDDLGIEPTAVKHYGNEILPLADIIHRRANEHLMTIIITNLDGPGILDKYGPRVHDRMRDMTTINLTGESNRGHDKYV